MQLIIIGGQAGVGKTTLAHLVAEQAFELGFIPVVSSFAATLKQMAKESGCPKEEDPEGYRKFCQKLGAEKRSEDPDYWINLFDKELNKIQAKEKRDLKNKEKYWERCVIVDDCRYANEVKYAIAKQACTVFLMYGNRDNPNKEKNWTAHESEEMANTVYKNPKAFKDAFQYFVYNDETLEELKNKAEIGSPFWCGVHCDPDASEKMQEISRCLSQLIDMLLLETLEEGEDFKEGAD